MENGRIQGKISRKQSESDIRIHMMELRLEMLGSLTRSQQALARIIESMADITAASSPVVERLLDSVDRMGRCQLAFAALLAGKRQLRRRSGTPASPWFPQKSMTMTSPISRAVRPLTSRRQIHKAAATRHS